MYHKTSCHSRTLSTLQYLVVLVFVIFISTKSFAQQTDPPVKGKLYISAGIGAGVNLTQNYDHVNFLPVSVSLDFAFLQHITIGPYIALFHTQLYNGYEHAVFAVQGAYHFDIPSSRFGVYAGGLLGYHYYDNPTQIQYNYFVVPPLHERHTVVAAFVGGQAFLSTRLAAFAELGYGVTYARIGLSVRLK